MNKKALRTLYKQKRATISAEQQALLSQQIAQQTLRLPIWDKQIFHSFLSIMRASQYTAALGSLPRMDLMKAEIMS